MILDDHLQIETAIEAVKAAELTHTKWVGIGVQKWTANGQRISSIFVMGCS